MSKSCGKTTDRIIQEYARFYQANSNRNSRRDGRAKLLKGHLAERITASEMKAVWEVSGGLDAGVFDRAKFEDVLRLLRAKYGVSALKGKVDDVMNSIRLKMTKRFDDTGIVRLDHTDTASDGSIYCVYRTTKETDDGIVGALSIINPGYLDTYDTTKARRLLTMRQSKVSWVPTLGFKFLEPYHLGTRWRIKVGLWAYTISGTSSAENEFVGTTYHPPVSFRDRTTKNFSKRSIRALYRIDEKLEAEVDLRSECIVTGMVGEDGLSPADVSPCVEKATQMLTERIMKIAGVVAMSRLVEAGTK